jgi:hypothetical protein
LSNARQTSKIDNMYDVFYRAVDKSDPVVLSVLEPKLLAKRPRRSLPADIASLLVNQEEAVEADLPAEEVEVDHDDDDDDNQVVVMQDITIEEGLAAPVPDPVTGNAGDQSIFHDAF